MSLTAMFLKNHAAMASAVLVKQLQRVQLIAQYLLPLLHATMNALKKPHSAHSDIAKIMQPLVSGKETALYGREHSVQQALPAQMEHAYRLENIKVCIRVKNSKVHIT